MRSRFLNWLLLRLVYPKYVKEIEEASEIYAIRSWIKNHEGENYTFYRDSKKYIKKDFSSVEFAFIDGYSKALYDNGLKFENGKVVKDIERFV